MKIAPLAKIAAARKRLIEKETTMKIDVDGLWAQACDYTGVTYWEFARLIIEECALEAEECKNEILKDIYNDACSDCAAAIRALKP